MGAEVEEYEFDVALSFAGEDRPLVQQVVDGLHASEVKVFYDQDRAIESWGEDLIEYFTNAYMNRSRYAIIFISQPYSEKMWTTLERRTVLARAMKQKSAYVLPVRIDETPLTGLLPTVGAMDVRDLGVVGLVQAIRQKVGTGVAAPTFTAAPAGKVPRTQAGIHELIAQRPPVWEFLLYAAVLLQGLESTKEKYRDHIIGYAQPGRFHVTGDEIYPYLQRAFSEAMTIGEFFERVLSQEAQRLAFGDPGVPGDPDSIVHLARRFISVYEDFLDWAARLRGTSTPIEEWREALSILAHYADKPTEVLRTFVDNFVGQVETFTDRISRGEAINLEMNVKLDIDPDVLKRYEDAVERARRA